MTLISRCPGHLWKAGLCLCFKDRTWGQVPGPHLSHLRLGWEDRSSPRGFL